jgi:triacylglycerol lipase
MAANKRTKLFLVPGFFGFNSIGALNYFNRVDRVLGEALADLGETVDIVECETMPTGSIRNRSLRLLDEVVAAGGLEADAIHFVGHSTGGLDIRLLLTPGVRLRPGDDEGEVAARTRTAITLCTPHFGTPLANYGNSLQGRNLLQFLSVMATSEQGRYGLFAAAQLTRLIAEFDDRLGRRDTALDVLAKRLFKSISLSDDDPLWQFLQEMSEDQGAVVQLTPAGMDLFNAAVNDRPGVRYGAVVTAAPPPRFRRLAQMGSIDRGTRYTVFSLLHRLTASRPGNYPYPSPGTEALRHLMDAFPFVVERASNDGIVPTFSQSYGVLVHAAVADHLDVVGQFYDAGGQPYADWLPSGSAFDETAFVELWRRIADFMGTEGDLGTS